MLTEIMRRARLAPSGFKRAVATDADGTLWATDVGDLLFQTLCQRGDVRGAALTRLRGGARELLKGDGPSDLGALGGLLMERYRAGEIGIRALCDLQAEAVADRSREALEQAMAEIADEGAALFRPEIRELLTQARAHGFEVHVVTGSLGWVVEATLRKAGVTVDSVSGGVLIERDGWVLPQLAGEIPLFEHKAEALGAKGARPAAIGLGDGGWDAPFLHETHVPVLVYATATLVEAMRARPDAVRIG